MPEQQEFDDLFDELSDVAPAGYAVALRIRFAAPLYLRSAYPEGWQEIYTTSNFQFRDPVLFWGVGNAGARRWSEIPLPDPFKVFEQARDWGLSFGVVASAGKITVRSVTGAARSDREFTDDEMERVANINQRLHDLSRLPEDLTKAMIEALHLVRDGYRQSTAALELGISESAFKARLTSARLRLDARTTAEAVRKAQERGLI